MIWMVVRVGLLRMWHGRTEILLSFVVPIVFFTVFAFIFDEQIGLGQSPKVNIALVDEAHYARRKNPRNGARSYPQFGNLYKAINKTLKKKTSSLWMATATPMQLDWIEVFDLISLIDRIGAFQRDPSLVWSYYQALGELVGGNDIEPAQWDFLRRGLYYTLF